MTDSKQDAIATTELTDDENAAAVIPRRVELVVAPSKPAGGYVPGDYTGSVHMVFDAVPPVGGDGNDGGG